MTTELIARPISPTARRPWPLELEVEVAPSAAPVTGARAGALADRVRGTHGIDRVSAEPHCAGRFVLVRLTVEAFDMADAVETTCALVHSCAADAGLGQVVLVAVGAARQGG